MSFHSLTAYWIAFTIHHITLQAEPYRGSHTSQAIANISEDMLQIWGIPKSSVHVVLRDNVKNMIKTMADAGFSSLPCARPIQLVVHVGLLSQRRVADAVVFRSKNSWAF